MAVLQPAHYSLFAGCMYELWFCGLLLTLSASILQKLPRPQHAA